MLSTRDNRASRREASNGKRARKFALAGASLGTAAVLSAGLTAPAANAAEWGGYPCGTDGKDTCYGYSAYTSGALLALLTPLVDIFSGGNLSVPAPLYTGYNLDYRSTAKGLYNAINDQPYGDLATWPKVSCYMAGARGYADDCRTAFTFSTGAGAFNVVEALNALWSSAAGTTPEGYDPIAPVGATPGGAPSTGAYGVTNIGSLFLNNVLRPDGGIATRFASLLNAFGVDTSMPNSGLVGPTKPDTEDPGPGGQSVFQQWVDVTWPYNPQADFPITLNPLSLLNSAFAALPPKQLVDQFEPLFSGGVTVDALYDILKAGQGTSLVQDAKQLVQLPAYDNCIDQFSCSVTLFTFGALQVADMLSADFPAQVLPPPLKGLFATLASAKPDLPITSPLYIAAGLTNPLLEAIKSPYLLGSPLADIVTPALKILVNIGYDDVITPDKLNTVDPGSFFGDTYAEEGYVAYDRTFRQLTPLEPTPFAWFNNPALTAEQTSAAYSDAWNAFTGALKAQTEKPFWGLLVPNPDNPPAGAATPAAAKVTAAQAVSPAPAAATPVQQAPVSTPAPVDAPAVVAPVVDEPAPVSAPKPDLSAALSAVADNEPAAPAHRVTRTPAATTGDSGADAGQGTGDNAGSGQHSRR